MGENLRGTSRLNLADARRPCLCIFTASGRAAVTPSSMSRATFVSNFILSVFYGLFNELVGKLSNYYNVKRAGLIS